MDLESHTIVPVLSYLANSVDTRCRFSNLHL